MEQWANFVQKENENFKASVYGGGRIDPGAAKGSMSSARPVDEYDYDNFDAPATGFLGDGLPPEHPHVAAAQIARTKMNFVFTNFQSAGILDPNAAKTLTDGNWSEKKQKKFPFSLLCRS